MQHFGYCMSGNMKIEYQDGSSFNIKEGDCFVINPGHEAYVEGSDKFCGLDFNAASAHHWAGSFGMAGASTGRTGGHTAGGH
jgi:mannose-6-phosphate isomerase-like protein (cupin superfamily)